MAYRRPRVNPPPPPKPPTPPKPPSVPPKPTIPPKATAPDTPNAPRSSGFSPVGMVGGLATAGLGIGSAFMGGPLGLASGLADALNLDELGNTITDFLGDITGFNYLKENPLVAVGVVGGVSYVGLKFLRVI